MNLSLPPEVHGVLSLEILHHFQNLELLHMEGLLLYQATKVFLTFICIPQLKHKIGTN